MRNPILVGVAEEISLVPDAVQRVLEADGLYVFTSPSIPGEAPVLSMDGKIYSLDLGKEMPPECVVDDVMVSGPLRGVQDAPPDSVLHRFISTLKAGRLQHCVHDEWNDCDLEKISIGYLLRARDFRIVDRDGEPEPVPIDNL